jgi:hypothetical protein
MGQQVKIFLKASRTNKGGTSGHPDMVHLETGAATDERAQGKGGGRAR